MHRWISKSLRLERLRFRILLVFRFERKEKVSLLSLPNVYTILSYVNVAPSATLCARRHVVDGWPGIDY